LLPAEQRVISSSKAVITSVGLVGQKGQAEVPPGEKTRYQEASISMIFNVKYSCEC